MRRLSLRASLLLIVPIAFACSLIAPMLRRSQVHHAWVLLNVAIGSPADVADQLSSPEQLSRACREPSIVPYPHLTQAADPAAELRQRLRIRAVRGTNHVEIWAAGNSDLEAIAIANALINASNPPGTAPLARAIVTTNRGVSTAELLGLNLILVAGIGLGITVFTRATCGRASPDSNI